MDLEGKVRRRSRRCVDPGAGILLPLTVGLKGVPVLAPRHLRASVDWLSRSTELKFVLRPAEGAWRIEGVFWKKHHPWFRRVLLAANGALPPAVFLWWALGAWSAFRLTFAAAAMAHAGLLLAIFHPRCPWLGPVARRFRTENRDIWLTLDDGPDGERSVKLAEELRSRGVHATFFVVGHRVRQQAATVRAIVAAGHTLANHSDTHPQASMWRAGPGMVAREVGAAEEALREHGGTEPWFRAPVGHKSPCLHPVLGRRGDRLVAWTVGGRDGWGPETASLLRRVLAAACPGAIVMLHEGRPHAVGTVLAVVDALLARGFRFVVPSDAALSEG